MNKFSSPFLTGQAIATCIAILAAFAVNTLSNFFPPGGKNIGEIANTVLSGVLITPENYAFIIWGVIYVGLFAYGIYQFRVATLGDSTLVAINGLLIGACLSQIVWVYMFTLQFFWWSVPFMLIILGTLMAAYWLLQRRSGRLTRRDRWMVQVPFSLYLAWISVATIVNVASALYASQWSEWGVSPAAWTAVMIGVATVIGAIVIWLYGDVAFAGVYVWAYVAIAVRQSDITAIWLTALVGVVALLGMLTARLSVGNQQKA